MNRFEIKEYKRYFSIFVLLPLRHRGSSHAGVFFNESACLACTRPLISFPSLQKEGGGGGMEGGREGEREGEREGGREEGRREGNQSER